MLTRSNLSFYHIIENDNEKNTFSGISWANLIIYFDENWNHTKNAEGIFGETFE